MKGWRARRRPVWADRRDMELLALGAVHMWPGSTRQDLATATGRDMAELLEPLGTLVRQGYITRRTDRVKICGVYSPVNVWGEEQPAKAGQATVESDGPPETKQSNA